MIAPPPLGSLETPTGLPARMPGALNVVIFLTLALTGSMEPRGVEATTPSMLAAPAASALEALAPVGEVVAGTVADVVARGTTAYAAVGERLVVLDVADDGPRVLGVMPAEADDVMAVAVAGTRGYLAAGTAGLRVVDVADPARPMSLGRWPGEAHAVALAGATAFVLGDGLHVLDVSGPTPREVASLEAGGLALAVAGDILAVAAGAEGVRFYDVATRGRPVLISTFPTPKGALDVALGDGRALVAAGLGGLRLLDIVDPRRPEEVGFFEMQVSGGCAPGSCTASATRVVLDGSRALVTWARCEAAFSCRFAPRVTVMDVLDPSAPTVAATLELEGNPVAVATAAGGILVAVRPLWWYQGIAPCRLAPGGLLLL
ncbi:MAG: LVIVD repeat-containing protein, partial [Anaerolineae bacterium]